MPISVLLYSAETLTCTGLSAKETASSTRAGLSGLMEGTWLDGNNQPAVMGRIPDEALCPLDKISDNLPKPTNRESRLLQLAITLLKDKPKTSSAKIAVYFILPEQTGSSKIEARLFFCRLAVQLNDEPFDFACDQEIFIGRAGGLQAILKASESIKDNPESLILIIGVDTYDDPVLLHRLERENRLKTEKNPDGFSPGEGAGLLLLGGVEAGKRHNLPPIAQLTIPAISQELGHLYSDQPYRGEGLSEAMQSLFAASPPSAPVRDIYCTMNGERHWAKEWGVALNRNRAHFASEIYMHHPAENFGDIGAAFGPVLVALAAIGIAKGYRQSPVLIYTSSDFGDRAVTLISAPE